MMEQTQTQVKRDKQLSEEALQDQATKLTQQSRTSLEKQADANRETQSRMRTQFADTESALTAELNQRKTTEDTQLVSPAAAHKIRAELIAGYEKTFASERKSNDKEIEGIRQRFSDQFSEVANHFDDQTTKMSREQSSELHKERAKLTASIMDTEDSKREMMNEMEASHNQSSSLREQQFSRAFEGLKRHYDRVMDKMRLESESEMQAIQDEHLFQRQIDHREASQRAQEQARRYEGQLSEQKNQFEVEISELKRNNQSETEKLTFQKQVEMENQQRQFEQRIASLIQSQKEREQNMQEHFEKEIESLRHAHDRLLRTQG